MKRKTEKPECLMAVLLTMLIAPTVAAQEPLAITGVCIPPAISAQPSNLSTVRRASLQAFSVEAAGTAPLSYQWYKSGFPAVAVGTNSSSYTIASVGPADVGYYYVVVTNACGTDTSAVIKLSLEPAPKSSTVTCPSSAVPPAVIAVAYHPCEGTINGVLESVTDTPNPITDKGTRVYKYSYSSKGGGVAYWEYIYTIDYSGGLLAPANTESTVSTPEEALDPGAPADITDACGRKVSAVLIGSSTPQSGGNTVIWTYRYTACDCKTTADWTHTYTIGASGNVLSMTQLHNDTTSQTLRAVIQSTGLAAVNPDVSPLTGKSACTMIIPNGFSPNGDGINDYFLVTCIEKYPDARLRIFSGASALIYEQEHYGNFDFWGGEDTAWWKGTDRYKNELASGTYIYVLDLYPGRNEPAKTGYVFISR